jgi:hypothetical protein
VHAHSQLLLDFLQLLSHALADRHAPHSIRPVPILPADMREAKEVEGLRLALPSAFPVLFGTDVKVSSSVFLCQGLCFLLSLRRTLLSTNSAIAPGSRAIGTLERPIVWMDMSTSRTVEVDSARRELLRYRTLALCQA